MKKYSFFVITIIMAITVNAQDYKTDSLRQAKNYANYLKYLNSTIDTGILVTIHVIDNVDRPELGCYLVCESDGSYDTINPLYSSQYVHSFPGRMKDNRDIGGGVEYFNLAGEPIEILQGQTITHEPYKKPISREKYQEKYNNNIDN